MIATLKELKAQLSELMTKAAQGEEIIITVHGKPKARLAAIAATAPLKPADWIRQLQALQRLCGPGRPPADGAAIVRDLRDERA